MERNRRVAKAYARVPVLTVSGSNEGFDGYKIGLNGFETPMNDPLVKRVKNHIGKVITLMYFKHFKKELFFCKFVPKWCQCLRL